jgi:hypothetical protein
LRLRLPGWLAGAAHKPLLRAAAQQRGATVELSAYGVYVASLQGQAR